MHQSGFRPSVCPSIIPNVNRARSIYSTWLAMGQHLTRPTYISVRVLGGRSCLVMRLLNEKNLGNGSGILTYDEKVHVRNHWPRL